MTDPTLFNVDEYTFEPIRGYPMLHWRGKRPFTATRYYPAQLKERHGQTVAYETTDWYNRIYWGDNLQVMSRLLKEFRGKINLVYIDPPFGSQADYKKKIKLRGKQITNDQTIFEEKQYTDIWTNDEYLQFMYERLILIRELLAEDGSIWLHCDWHKSHYLRCLLEEVFGSDSFVNEIAWCYESGGRSRKSFPSKHDNIFWYVKRKSDYIFNDMDIRLERDISTMHEPVLYDEADRPYQRNIKNGKEYRYYLDLGTIPYDFWTDIQVINPSARERKGYPTQKPEALLERIIKASSNKGDIVFDCFMGSGTTQAVAMKLGRRFIGADINLGAIQTTTKRLLSVAEELQCQQLSTDGEAPTYYTGFEVYHVNQCEVFRPQDYQDLQFKQDAEATITIDNGYLLIEDFYPMKLLSKLSLEKQNVEDWRQLVETIMIDWNYDGAIFEPKLIDIPDRNELVKDTYQIPPDAGTIRVKITDLLSESLEQNISLLEICTT